MDAPQFEALLDRLAADRESAGERYELLRLRLCKFFLLRGQHAPEELADETLDRVARRLAAGEELQRGDPAIYALGVARNVLRESWAKERRHEQAVLPTTTPADDGAVDPAALAALAACLHRLPPEHRSLVLAYYEGHHGSQIPARRELASTLGLGLNALRIRVHRIRQGLEECLRQRVGRERDPPLAPLPGGRSLS